MSFTRRIFGQAALGAAAAVPQVIREAGQIIAQNPLPSGLVERRPEGANAAAGHPRAPNVPWEQASALVSNNQTIVSLLRDRCREEWRGFTLPHMDVDIASKRSWSASYKMLVQRERFVEREVQRQLKPVSHWSNILEEEVRELMWGK